MEIVPNTNGITMFICANCARPGKKLTSADRGRPVVPEFSWPVPVQQIIVPCSGRLQPEHVLKVFESGSSVVSVVACREDNCHHIEGSRRCARRVEYIRSILKDIGLGDERLLLSYLPGSALEDLALVSSKTAPENHPDSLDAQIAAIHDSVVEVFRNLPPNPLLQSPPGTLDKNCSQEKSMFGGDDDDE